MASSARIDELRKKFDENPRRYFAPLANEYRKSGDPEQAVFICQEYLPQQPGHMSGHIVYGQALFELSRFDEARAVFETALSLDPENLIALRHLGDIARQAGDTRGARDWYQRVLEADPRNEEIAQVMLTLPGGGEASSATESTASADQGQPTPMEPTGPAAQSVEPSVTSTDRGGVDRGQEVSPVPVSHVPSDEPPPIPAAAPVSTWGEAPPPSADDDLLDLDDFSVGGVTLSSIGAPPRAIEPVEPPPLASSSMDESLSAFDSMSLAETPGTPGIDSPDVPPVDAPIELASDIELGLPDDGRTGTTFSEAQGERLADLETFGEELRGAEVAEPSALEVDSFFSDMGSAESLVETTPELPPIESHRVETPTAADEPIESHRAETPTVPFAPLESRRAEPPAPSGVQSPGYVDLVTPTASVEPPAATPTPRASLSSVSPAAPSEEFVTETMAELYLQQGHPEAAVDIYQRLVAQRPGDTQLAARFHAIEAVPRGESASEAPASTPAPARGPTIRQFLATLLRPFTEVPAEPETDSIPSLEASASAPVPMTALDRTVDQPQTASVPYDVDAVDAAAHEPEMPGSDSAIQASIDEDFGEPAQAFDALGALDAFGANDLGPGSADAPLSPARAFRRGTPGSSATVSGSIDALFSGTGPSAADSDAADTLSQAFAPDTPETPPAPLKGVPAHAASSELSLDHVFKSTQARRPDSENDGFSFDQFFSDELADNAPKGGTEPAGNSGTGGAPGDDIAQFNNWLNGLKKT